MSQRFDSYAEGLVLETVADTAQNFFGARRGLEQEIEIFQQRRRDLEEVERTARRRAGTLHFLLLDAEGVAGFYRALGLDVGQFVDAVDPDYRSLRFEPPFALFARGRYVKAVVRAYAMTQEAAQDYLHGRYHTDPKDQGRKVVSVHYDLLANWCERINTRIENLNRNMSPSGTMCFLRGLDPAAQEGERVTGATLEGRAQSLDQDLAFKPLPRMEMRQHVIPLLPPLSEVRGRVAGAARGLFGRRRAEARQALEGVRPQA